MMSFLIGLCMMMTSWNLLENVWQNDQDFGENAIVWKGLSVYFATLMAGDAIAEMGYTNAIFIAYYIGIYVAGKHWFDLETKEDHLIPYVGSPIQINDDPIDIIYAKRKIKEVEASIHPQIGDRYRVLVNTVGAMTPDLKRRLQRGDIITVSVVDPMVVAYDIGKQKSGINQVPLSACELVTTEEENA